MNIKRFSFLRSVYVLLVISVFSFFGVTHNVLAQGSSSEEAISSFVSTIKVNLDSSIDVDEVITYTTGTEAHHGIYRDIRTLSSTGEKMKISNINVVNEIGTPYNFVFSSGSQFVRIKIGDANSTFTGQKIYHLSYHVLNAIAFLKDVDEIYWNVTGNEWTMPIYESHATVILPEGLVSTQNACYFGLKGETNICQLESQSTGNEYVFDSPTRFNSGEGLTVSVGFPKGVVVQTIETFTDKNDGLIGAIVFIFATFVVMFTYWSNNWRDPKGTGVIVPQYDVPDRLTPMEVNAIVNENISTDSLSAEIIYLATLGYIKIKQIEKTTFGIIKTTDYEILSTQHSISSLNNFDQSILRGIFKKYEVGFSLENIKKEVEKRRSSSKQSPGVDLDDNTPLELESIILSDLQDHFYKKVSLIRKRVGTTLLEKMYYKNLGKMEGHIPYIFFIIVPPLFILVFGLVVFSYIPVSFIDSPVIEVCLSLFLVIIGIFWNLSPAKTEKGVATKEYLLGLKRYLQIAEKDRLDFHNAPEKKPEVFEKLLPYAMVLGVEKEWAQEFEGIYTTQPSWYEGEYGNHFSAISFGNSLSHFATLSSSTLASSPSSSGSGGGGSSGGGGGGGGGGSW